MSVGFADSPKTLTESGKPPETRIGTSFEVRDRIHLLTEADRKSRSKKRALVKGLVDGNPPYRDGDLRAAGRAEQCNVNWRGAESYLNNGRSPFYDVFSESPTFVTATATRGDEMKRVEHGNIVTEEFDTLVRDEDEDFDYEMQISQYHMVLYGCGPLMFEDEYSYCAIAIPTQNLLVPEFALSNQNKWEECAVLVDYYAHDLYKRIRNDKAATAMGWKLEAVRSAIINAQPKNRGGQTSNWDWYQQQLKNNSFGSVGSNVIQCAHYFVREFPEGNEEEGRITHAMVLIDRSTGGKEVNDFLFKRVGRFENWRQVIHPMYYDNDGGGYHHSVTGMGTKMASAMDADNRLTCNQFDKAFAPKQLFRPTTANAEETMKIRNVGDWGVLPVGYEAVQMPIGGFMEDSIIMSREIRARISAQLSQYRQNMEEKSGNPVTAEEIKVRQSTNSQLGKTQLNHYYRQLDWYYKEKFRRAALARNENMPYGKQAKEFQQRCTERGVPIEVVRSAKVQATRIIGQGSPMIRQQITGEFLASSNLNPSSAGRQNILDDYYASRAGQALVRRYSPKVMEMPADDDNRALAMMQVAGAKIGVPPVISPNQNNRIFAETFMQAMFQSLESLEQGGNPMEVHAFIQTLGPATGQHIQMLGQDPRNKQMAAKLEKDWKKIAIMADKLAAQIQQMQQQQQEQQQQRQRAQAAQNGGDPEMQLKAAETRGKLALQKEKQDATLRMKQQAHSQKLATNEATTRQKLVTTDVLTASKIVNDRKAQEAASVKDT